MATKMVTPDNMKNRILNAITGLYGALAYVSCDLFVTQTWVQDSTDFETLQNPPGYSTYATSYFPIPAVVLGDGYEGVSGNKATWPSCGFSFAQPLTEGPLQVYGLLFQLWSADKESDFVPLCAINAWDDQSGINILPPVGLTLVNSGPALGIVFNFRLWDFNQPTPP